MWNYRPLKVASLRLTLIFIGFISLLFFSAVGYQSSGGGYEFTSAPDEFELLMSSIGVALYEKHYTGGYPDFVQSINLSQGARLILLHGEVQEWRNGKGMFGGNDARFNSISLQQYWVQLTQQSDKAFCVTNGQFFYMLEYPTRLPFPLKVDDQILTDGYEDKNFDGQKLILEIWNDRVQIQPLTRENLYSSTAPDIVGGLAENARKSPEKYVARTFVGIKDQNKDGLFETVLVFNTQSARQKDAAEVLRSFGAEKVMMLDGGGSTQLICQTFSYITTDRLLPQAIGAVAGSWQSLIVTTSSPYITTQQPTRTVGIDTFEVNPPILKAEKTRNSTYLLNLSTTTPTAAQLAIASGQVANPAIQIEYPGRGTAKIGDVIWIPFIIMIIAPLIYLFAQNKRKM